MLKMKIVNILVTKKLHEKRKDIIRHGKNPDDYQITLELYEKEIKAKISEDIEKGAGSTIFAFSVIFFLLYLNFTGIIPIRELIILLILIFLISLMLFIPLVLFSEVLERANNFIKVIFSKNYPDNHYKSATVNKYHNWTKVGEHTVAYSWSSKLDMNVTVEDFKCSVCGKKAHEEIDC